MKENCFFYSIESPNGPDMRSPLFSFKGNVIQYIWKELEEHVLKKYRLSERESDMLADYFFDTTDILFCYFFNSEKEVALTGNCFNSANIDRLAMLHPSLFLDFYFLSFVISDNHICIKRYTETKISTCLYADAHCAAVNDETILKVLFNETAIAYLKNGNWSNTDELWSFLCGNSIIEVDLSFEKLKKTKKDARIKRAGM